MDINKETILEMLDVLDSVAGKEMGEGCKVLPNLTRLFENNPDLVRAVKQNPRLDYLAEFIRDYCTIK